MAGRDQEMAPPEVRPLTHIYNLYHFRQKWYPFRIPSLELCIHPFVKIVVNAVFLKYEKITKASNFLDFSQPRNRSVSPLRFTDRNDRSPYPFIHFN